MKKLICLFVLALMPWNLFSQGKVIDFKKYSETDFKSNDQVKVTLSKHGGIELNTAKPGRSIVTFAAPESIAEKLAPYTCAEFQVSNLGSEDCRVNIYLIDRTWVDSYVVLSPGESKNLKIALGRRSEDAVALFPGMQGAPGGTLSRGTDLSRIKQVKVEIYSNGMATIKLSDLYGADDYISPAKIASQTNFFPFIDVFGQYIHGQWPGKITGVEDMKGSHEKELIELNNIPAPANFNRYGGWDNGPELNATGHFRVEKYNNRWWLVDPDGKLFWSHGPTCVRFSNAETQVTGREKFFRDLPAPDSEYAFCYNRTNNGDIYNFTAANLYRKFGPDWKKLATEMLSKRFRSWGMNTYANWSDPDIYLSEGTKVPYTVNINSGGPRLDGNTKKFPDPFDPAFITSLENGVKLMTARTADDPYCIGYFVDNELSVRGLSESAMKQDARGYAKNVLLNMLKAKYPKIQDLNKAWQTSYRNWNAILGETALPEAAGADSREFEKMIVDKYYSECQQMVKKYAGNKLYMGSRLHTHYFPDDQAELYIVEIAARYCDIISFNRYRFISEDLVPPKGIDKPLIIGEFHFGALDRGYFHTGLRGVADQKQRAEAYIDFLEGSLRNPFIVGAHWFQYGAQAFTGRFDGENYQIGIVDICDIPYPEMVDAIRKVGYRMYDLRNGVGN